MKSIHWVKLIVIILLIFSLVLLFGLFYQNLNDSNNKTLKSTLINQKAPNFIVSDLLSEQNLNSEILFRERYTLLNVFASWCVSCKDEHRHLMKLKRDGQLQIIGLNYKDKKQDAIEFLNQLGNPYHQIIADDGSIGFEYGVYAVPETFLIDKNGIIKYKLVGVLSNDIIQKAILPLIQ